ncbi:Hypothetical protein FKW44_021952 [Caligus rogercresseyi]|uniref:Uncharacterized protein n=1 Tax=Caligus rogercresseyi TaxID=217165 RepID=A0A7T8JW85_CALRO|nr:Hypothetical protein FKW44_021952 [Caligus rogercresseyi]
MDEEEEEEECLGEEEEEEEIEETEHEEHERQKREKKPAKETAGNSNAGGNCFSSPLSPYISPSSSVYSSPLLSSHHLPSPLVSPYSHMSLLSNLRSLPKQQQPPPHSTTSQNIQMQSTQEQHHVHPSFTIDPSVK